MPRHAGLLGFFVDHFPEENGQNQSPSARLSTPESSWWIEQNFFKKVDYCDLLPPQAD